MNACRKGITSMIPTGDHAVDHEMYYWRLEEQQLQQLHDAAAFLFRQDEVGTPAGNERQVVI